MKTRVGSLRKGKEKESDLVTKWDVKIRAKCYAKVPVCNSRFVISPREVIIVPCGVDVSLYYLPFYILTISISTLQGDNDEVSNWINNKMDIIDALDLRLSKSVAHFRYPPTILACANPTQVRSFFSDSNDRLWNWLGLIPALEVVKFGPDVEKYDGSRLHTIMSHYRRFGIKIATKELTGYDLKYTLTGKNKDVLYLGE